MTMQTPLRLERYFFTKINMESNPDFKASDAPASNPLETEVGVNVELLKHVENPVFQLTLTLDHFLAKEAHLPYKIALQIVGIFAINPEPMPTNLERLITVNGASILYSAARELVLLLTGRGPWSPLQLPTINFHSAIPENQEKASKTTQK